MKKYLPALLLLFLGFKGFSQDTRAEYEGGNVAFANKFMEMLHAYVDFQAYTTYIINVDKTGKANHLDVFQRSKMEKCLLMIPNMHLKKLKVNGNRLRKMVSQSV